MTTGRWESKAAWAESFAAVQAANIDFDYDEASRAHARSSSWCPLRQLMRKDCILSEWIFFMHPERDDFIETMSEAEGAAFAAHAAWLRGLLADGRLVVSGPCLGRVNTGVMVFEADDEASAQRIVAAEPVTSGGHMRGDLRPYRLGLLRGRDG